MLLPSTHRGYLIFFGSWSPPEPHWRDLRAGRGEEVGLIKGDPVWHPERIEEYRVKFPKRQNL